MMQLEELGLALENMGATAAQSIAGATATGTHGTGRLLGSMSTQIVALRMVLANGTLVELDSKTHPQIFTAARVSLGTLGIVTAVTLRVVDLFRMRLDMIPMDLDDLLTQLPTLMVGGWAEVSFRSVGTAVKSPRLTLCAIFLAATTRATAMVLYAVHHSSHVGAANTHHGTYYWLLEH